MTDLAGSDHWGVTEEAASQLLSNTMRQAPGRAPCRRLVPQHGKYAATTA